MFDVIQRKASSRLKRRNGFTATELLVSVAAGGLIMGASATGLRFTERMVSESQGKATLRQNTTNGLRLMRSEIERSMNLLITRTETLKEGEEDTDLMSNHAEVVNQCNELSGNKGFKPLFGINMVELEDPVVYGVSLSSNGRGYAILRCGVSLNMDGTYSDSQNSQQNNGDEEYQSEKFVSQILDDIGTIPCKVSDLAEDKNCPQTRNLNTVLNEIDFHFKEGKTPARTNQEPALRIQTDLNTKLVKFIDPYELDDNKDNDPYQISASYLEKTSRTKSQTTQELYFAAFARADKRVRFGYNATNSGEGQGYSGGAFFQNITSSNVRFILDGSGSMSACVAWSGEIGNTKRRFYDPQTGYYKTKRICSFTRMEALQNEMIDIIQNLPDYTKIGLAAFSTEGNRNNKNWEKSKLNLVELGPINSEVRQSAINFVLSLSNSNPKYWGGTMPWSSLDQAFADGNTDTIYFLSDGKPNFDPNNNSWNVDDYEKIAKTYEDLNATRVTNNNDSIAINSTSLGLESEWMQILSSRTSGEYIKIDDI